MKFHTLVQSSRVLGTLTAVAIAVSPVAAMAAEPGLYLGGNIGLSRTDIDEDRIRDGLVGQGFTVSSFDDDERDLGYKLFGGYQFNRFLALEAGYFDLGKFDFDATTIPTGTFAGEIEITGFNVDLVGSLPLSKRFSAFGRGGVTREEAEVKFTRSGAVAVTDASRDKSETNYKFGFGVEYAITSALGLRAEAERYRIDDAVGNDGDVDLYSLGLVYRFAAPRAVPVSSDPAPAAAPVVDPAPAAAAPAPATPAPAPARRRVTFSADSLFDFDQAVVKANGRRELDALAADLKDTRYNVITVAGHTDRLGSDAYNRELSTRRAEAVKAYLVSTGIPASRIETRGLAASEPVTRSDDCKTTLPRAQRIVCLQPDRRVEVEVTGTQD